MVNPEIWIDFHHTVSSRCGACPGGDPREICAGEPQEGVREAFESLSKLGAKIVIYTGYGTFIGDDPRAKEEIRSWLIKHELDKFVSRIKVDKPTWFLFIGDRGIGHVNWRLTLKEVRRIYERDIKGTLVKVR